jgi:hypothetical protein
MRLEILYCPRAGKKPARIVLLGSQIENRLFSFITAIVVVSIVILSLISSSTLIARGAIAIIVVHIFSLVAGSIVRAVVIVGGHFFIGVCTVNQRLRTGSESVRRLSRAPQSKG